MQNQERQTQIQIETSCFSINTGLISDEKRRMRSRQRKDKANELINQLRYNNTKSTSI